MSVGPEGEAVCVELQHLCGAFTQVVKVRVVLRVFGDLSLLGVGRGLVREDVWGGEGEKEG